MHKMAKRSDLETRAMIGRKLALARERSGMLQHEVAIELFGVAQKNRISEMENGKTLPDAELLQVMCSLYRVSVDWVLGFTINPELNETESVAGVIFNSFGELLADNLNAVTFQMALLCSKHITSFPKALSLQLLEKSKVVSNQYVDLMGHGGDDRLKPFIMELLQIIKECEKDQAIQFNYLAKGLEDIFERDENNVQEKILLDLKKSRKTRFAQTTLPKGDCKDMQMDFLDGSGLG